MVRAGLHQVAVQRRHLGVRGVRGVNVIDAAGEAVGPAVRRAGDADDGVVGGGVRRVLGIDLLGGVVPADAVPGEDGVLPGHAEVKRGTCDGGSGPGQLVTEGHARRPGRNRGSGAALRRAMGAVKTLNTHGSIDLSLIE